MPLSVLWTEGKIIPESELRISALDRAFEHGLGLFETFRTWRGHPTLLDRHLDRLQRSAQALGLPLSRVVLPGPSDVADLCRAVPHTGDHRLRLILSGGLDEHHGAILWMRASAPPTPATRTPAIIHNSIPVWENDPLARHKTLNYWPRRIAHEQAGRDGADEVLTHAGSDAQRLLWEGTRANLFVIRDNMLITPPSDGPILPGVMRAVVLDWAGRLGIATRETPVSQADLGTVSEAFLTNSARGVWPISRLLGRVLPAPGALTTALWNAILPWLESGGNPS